MKDLHEKIGSDMEGRGFQVVHRLENNVWLPGPVFEWGVGDGAQQIGQTLLGKGKQGEEIYLCAWQGN